MDLDSLLNNVTKPARYAGNEYNLNIKENAQLRFCLCFPDVYEVGMSHLGSSIIYNVLNSRGDTACERCYSPWTDMHDALVQKGFPLFSLETRTPLSKFDIIGVSICYEMCYTNIINLLKLSGVSVRSSERGDDEPMVWAGGGAVYNCEPVAEIFDLVMIGEGEEVICELMDLYAAHKREGFNKRVFLREASALKGVYVPSLYSVDYNVDGTVKSVSAREGAPQCVEKRIIEDLDAAPYPTAPLVPYLNVVHDRMVLEIFRGCTRGCRFCQAGFVYRPIREKRMETLLKQAGELYANTGCDEISLCSLSSGDYSQIIPLTRELTKRMNDKNVSVALPSLRADAMLGAYAGDLNGVRRTGLTLAPEAGSQRLRDAINKNVTEEDILKNARAAFEAGFDTVKLYFMLGLPGETDEDVDAIAGLAVKIRELYYELPREKRKRPPSITVSASCFVPKAFTPFEFAPQEGMDVLGARQRRLKDRLKGQKGIKFNYHDAKTSFLEAVFSRGDRRLLQVIIRAAELGARFDAWNECFDFDIWTRAFEDCGIDPHFYANRARGLDETLPWEHISCGVSKAYLAAEYKKSALGEKTPDCRQGCRGCGGSWRCAK